jgi:hypothetical protein
MPAYLVLLRVEIARFTLCGAWPRTKCLFGSGLRPRPIGLHFTATGSRRPSQTTFTGPCTNSSLLL